MRGTLMEVDVGVQSAAASTRAGQRGHGGRGGRTWWALATGLLVPLGLAAAWIPIRSRIPNADLALILVGSVAAVGVLERRAGVAVAALSATFWFEFFDTVPYQSWDIARLQDVETTIVLAAVSVLGGELVLRAKRYRRRVERDGEQLASMRAAAALIASGEELVRVIESVVAQLRNLLSLDSCTFEAMAAEPPLPRVGRDGVIDILADEPVVRAELPVTVQGEALGYFVLGFGAQRWPETDRLLAALTLADHVGAAFLAQAPPTSPPPDRPEPRLRVVGAGTGGGIDAAGRGRSAPTRRRQETAGRSSLLGRMIS